MGGGSGLFFVLRRATAQAHPVFDVVVDDEGEFHRDDCRMGLIPPLRPIPNATR